MLLDLTQGFESVARRQRPVTLGFQAETDHPRDLGLIVDDENAGTGTVGSFHRLQ